MIQIRNTGDDLFAAVLEREQAWWHVSRQFYEYCSQFTKAELETMWEDRWRKMAVDHYRNTDAYPNCEETNKRGHATTVRWRENVNQKRATILRHAKDYKKPGTKTKDKPPTSASISSDGADIEDTGKITVDFKGESEDTRVNKLLQAFTLLSDDGKRDFMLRAQHMV